MTRLLDACVWGGATANLTQAGHDTVWAGDWLEDPGDEQILAIAMREGRTLVTLDKDFGEMVVVHGRPHCGVIRLVNIAARQQGPICVRILTEHGADLLAGGITAAPSLRIATSFPSKRNSRGNRMACDRPLVKIFARAV